MNKSHVPNTNHIPQQLQFITHPLQQQLNQQPHQLVAPIAIVTPPPKLLSQTDNDLSNGPVSFSFIFLSHFLFVPFVRMLSV